MMPDGDTAAHLREQVGGLFFAGFDWRHSFSGKPATRAGVCPVRAVHSISQPGTRNEPEGRSFNLRCNTSRIVPDFVHALWSAYDDRGSPLSDTSATIRRASCASRPQ